MKTAKPKPILTISILALLTIPLISIVAHRALREKPVAIETAAVPSPAATDTGSFGDLVKAVQNRPEKKEIDARILAAAQAHVSEKPELAPLALQEKAAAYLELERQVDKADNEPRFWSLALNDKSLITTAKATLLDLDYAISAYGKSQAEARVFAIQSLQHAASEGDFLPLESTLERLIAAYEADPKSFDPHGRSQDLSDLITSWIEAHGKERFVQDPSAFFERFYSGRVPNRSEVLMIMKAAHNIVAASFDDVGFRDRFYRHLRKQI